MTLQDSINALRSHDFSTPDRCSGYRQEIYLDPEDRSVYVFACAGSGWPMRAHHGVDVHVLSVPGDAIADSVAECLLAGLGVLEAVCDDFRGTRWDGSNHVGVWAEESQDELDQIDWPEIACAWDACDWLEGDTWEECCRREGVDPERGAEAIPEVAASIRGTAEGDGTVVLGVEDYLADRLANYLDDRPENYLR